MRLGHTDCLIDELSQDTLVNQIVYSSLKRLGTLDSIDDGIRENIYKTLCRFPAISRIHLSNKTFDRVKPGRNSRYYSLALHICKYFKEQFPQVHREYIHFQLSPFGMMFKRAGEALPVMETDVSLYNPQTGVKKILDAKYYKEALVAKYGAQEKIRRDHLSQIISYVMNQEDSSNPHTLDTSGTLVYPTVDEDFDFSYRYRDTNHMIRVTTVNLNQDWNKIEARIKEIVGTEYALEMLLK